MGRLTKDPELRRTGSGIAVASFTVAVDRDFKNDDERETDFLECVAWRGAGEFVARNFHKGKMIVVAGRIQQRSWTDKDGNKRRNTEIVADNVYFGDSKKDAPSGEAYSNNADQYSANDFAKLEDDDAQLPF
jgi:single-strand DNA-binding protein